MFWRQDLAGVQPLTGIGHRTPVSQQLANHRNCCSLGKQMRPPFIATGMWHTSELRPWAPSITHRLHSWGFNCPKASKPHVLNSVSFSSVLAVALIFQNYTISLLDVFDLLTSWSACKSNQTNKIFLETFLCCSWGTDISVPEDREQLGSVISSTGQVKMQKSLMALLLCFKETGSWVFKRKHFCKRNKWNQKVSFIGKFIFSEMEELVRGGVGILGARAAGGGSWQDTRQVLSTIQLGWGYSWATRWHLAQHSSSWHHWDRALCCTTAWDTAAEHTRLCGTGRGWSKLSEFRGGGWDPSFGHKGVTSQPPVPEKLTPSTSPAVISNRIEYLEQGLHIV